MDGLMACNFTSYFILFPSNKDDGWVIMKAVCSGTPFTIEKTSVSKVIQTVS